MLLEKKVYNQKKRRKKNSKRRINEIVGLFNISILPKTFPYEYTMLINSDHLRALIALGWPDRHKVVALKLYKTKRARSKVLKAKSDHE